MRSTINFVLDLLLGIALLGLVWTGIVIRFLLPPGSGGRLGLWEFGRHDWGDVHFWLAVAVATIVVIHVAMHWNWVCTYVLRSIGRVAPRSSGGLWVTGSIVLIATSALIAGSLWFANGHVGPSAGGETSFERAHGEARGGGQRFRGGRDAASPEHQADK